LNQKNESQPGLILVRSESQSLTGTVNLSGRVSRI